MSKPYEIVNIVASVSFEYELELDLNKICIAFPDEVYKPEKFPGLVYHFKDTTVSVLIFKSGKMVRAGYAKSTDEAKNDVYRVIEDLRNKGIDVPEKPNIDIQNIVAYGKLEHDVDLEKVSYTLTKTLYEPEQFPGLVYRIDDPNAVFLVFSNGKFVCTKTKTENDLDRAVENLSRELQDKNLFLENVS